MFKVKSTSNLLSQRAFHWHKFITYFFFSRYGSKRQSWAHQYSSPYWNTIYCYFYFNWKRKPQSNSLPMKAVCKHTIMQTRWQQKFVCCTNTEIVCYTWSILKETTRNCIRKQTVTSETWYNLQGREKIPFSLLILRRIWIGTHQYHSVGLGLDQTPTTL